MDEHAKAIAERWAEKRVVAIVGGMKPEAFDKHMLAFMRWGGWSEEKAQAICRRAKQLSERSVDQCEHS